MLAISPLITSNGDERGQEALGGFPSVPLDEFSDSFSGGPMLEDIDFNDFFLGFNDGDVLPDLEIFADFSFGDEEEQGTTAMAVEVSSRDDQEKALPASEGETSQEKDMNYGEEVVSDQMSKDNGLAAASAMDSPSMLAEAQRGRKPPAAHSKGSHGKRKVKVDWTPELHRRFVQAVEQLGVDKAVPSRVLELMGTDCLTRHNIASHLQKYRSHRKHLLAREAEAASWSQRRHLHASGAGVSKRDMNPWLAPTIGFPPPPPPPTPIQPFRPLHVWGHPTTDQTSPHVWPKHLVPARSPPPPHWLPHPHPPPLWHPHYSRGPREGWAPCFPQPLPAMRFSAPLPVPGIPPHPLYRPDSPVALPSKKLGSMIQLDAHPSKESIDAAIGDVLAKPWLPLPLGLKPPCLEGVLGELHKKGVSKVPPTCS